MIKYLIVICILITSCTPYNQDIDAVLELNNIYPEIELLELDNDIILRNISNDIIIEINYNWNDYNNIIHDSLVPNEIVVIGKWTNEINIEVIINNIEVY